MSFPHSPVVQSSGPVDCFQAPAGKFLWVGKLTRKLAVQTTAPPNAKGRSRRENMAGTEEVNLWVNYH